MVELIDTWKGLAVGGCAYHVNHPGGRSYDTFPVNACEAESRRVNRFWDSNHSPGTIRPSEIKVTPQFPIKADGVGDAFQPQAVRSFFLHNYYPLPL